MDVMNALGLFAAVIPWAIIVGLIVFLGGMPGRVAKKAGHPDAAAIRVGGWTTLLLGIVGYPWVLMWAYRTPKIASGNSAANEDSPDLTRLMQRVADLERRLNQQQTDSKES